MPRISLQVEVEASDEKALDEAVKALHEAVSGADGVNLSGFNYGVDGVGQLKRALGEEGKGATKTKARTTTGNPSHTAGTAKAAGAKKNE